MERTLLTVPYCPSIITWALGTNQKAKLYSVDKTGTVGLESAKQKMDRPNRDDVVRQHKGKTLGWRVESMGWKVAICARKVLITEC